MGLSSIVKAVCVAVAGVAIGACGLSEKDLEVTSNGSLVKITNTSKATIDILSVSFDDGACQLLPFRWTVTTSAKDEKPTPSMEWRATKPANETGTNVLGERFSSEYESLSSMPLAVGAETFVETCLEGGGFASLVVNTNRGSRKYNAGP